MSGRPAAPAAQHVTAEVGTRRQGGPPVPSRPVADCAADGAGGLVLDVLLPDALASHGAEATLLLVPRAGGPAGGGPPESTVRRALAAVGGGAGALRAHLPGNLPLAEGRWDAQLQFAGEKPWRLAAGVHDLRALADRTLGHGQGDGQGGVCPRLPYRTRYGNLSLRTWWRRPHAEVGDLHLVGGGLLLAGALYGTELAGTARLVARPSAGGEGSRGGSDALVREVTGPALPGVQRRATVGARFLAHLPYGHLTQADSSLWSLWLRPAEGAESVRLARLLDDVLDKRQSFSYPPREVAGGRLRAQPGYTADNELSVRVDVRS